MVREKALIVCVGNSLVGDDAAGCAVYESLARESLPDGVRLHLLGVAGISLLEILAGENILIVVDAVQFGAKPGTVHILDWSELPQARGLAVSAHGIGLREAIDLVNFAFHNARQGDVFIRKAPACTIGDLATALKNIFNSNIPLQYIGTRHGEKIYETLATSEELRRAEDMGDYYRVQFDNRDLNYNKYFTEGDPEEAAIEDYTSHNTDRLNIKQVEKLLLTLPEITSEL